MKPKDDMFSGITLVINGETIGKIEAWEPIDQPKDCVELVRTVRPESLWSQEISLPVSSIPEIFGPEVSGKSTLEVSALRRLLAPGHRYVQAQLEMWGCAETKQVCWNCLIELATMLADMGYRVWFDEKATGEQEFAAACGVVVQDYKLTYAGTKYHRQKNSKGEPK